MNATQRRQRWTHVRQGSQRPFREQLDDAMLLHVQPFLAKVTLRVERPVQRADDPVLQPLDVDRDLLVELFAPRRKHRTVVLEALDGALAKRTDVVDGTLQIEPLFAHEDDDHVVRIMARLLDVVRKDVLFKKPKISLRGRAGVCMTCVGPGDEVVGGLFHSHDDRVRHDLVGQVDAGSVFDERKAGLAAARISPDGDVRFKIRDAPIGAVVRLFGDGNEEQVHRVDEPLRASRTTGLDEATKVPVQFDGSVSAPRDHH